MSTGAFVASDDSNDDEDHSSTAPYGRDEEEEENGNTQSSGNASDGTGGDGEEDDGYGMTNAGGEPVYEVEKILGDRRKKGKLEYQIQWKGYADPTWEPKSCLKTCDDLLAEFLAAKKAKEEEKKRATAEKRRASMGSKASPKPRTPASAVSAASVERTPGSSGSKGESVGGEGLGGFLKNEISNTPFLKPDIPIPGPTPRPSRSASVTPHMGPQGARPRRQSSVDRSMPAAGSAERHPTNPEGFAFTSALAKKVNSMGKRSLAAMGASGGAEWEDVVVDRVGLVWYVGSL